MKFYLHEIILDGEVIRRTIRTRRVERLEDANQHGSTITIVDNITGKQMTTVRAANPDAPPPREIIKVIGEFDDAGLAFDAAAAIDDTPIYRDAGLEDRLMRGRGDTVGPWGQD